MITCVEKCLPKKQGRHCPRHSCLEKMSPSLPHTPCYLQRSTPAAEAFKLVPGRMWGLVMTVSSRGLSLAVFLLFWVWIETPTKSLIFGAIPSYFPSVRIQVCACTHTPAPTGSSQGKRTKGNQCMLKSCRNIFSKVLIMIPSVFVTVIKRGLILKNRVHSSSF